MSDRCLLCSLNPQTGALLCWKHVDALSDMLNPDNKGRPDEDVAASIPRLWAKLDPTPGGGGSYDERRPPGFESSPAASLHVITMRDDRSRNDPQVWFGPAPSGRGEDWTRPYTEEESPPRAIHAALVGLAESLEDELGELVSGPRIGPLLPGGGWFDLGEVVAVCGMLHERVERLIAYHHVDEIFLDLLELSDQIRRAVGDGDLGPSGWCRELVRDRHSYGYRYCGGPLDLLPPVPDPPVPDGETVQEAKKRKDAANRAEVARCPRCYRRYSWLDLIRIQYIDKPDAESA